MAVDASVLTFAVVAAGESNYDVGFVSRERDQPAIAPLHKTAGASPVPVVSQSSPPHQRILLPHYRLLHCLLRRAHAGGDDGEKKGDGEH